MWVRKSGGPKTSETAKSSARSGLVDSRLCRRTLATPTVSRATPVRRRRPPGTEQGPSLPHLGDVHGAIGQLRVLRGHGQDMGGTLVVPGKGIRFLVTSCVGRIKLG